MADSQVLKALLPDNPLCGIDTNKDALNLATGACTRQIKKVVFDGTEEWNYEASVGYHNFYTTIQYSDGVTSSTVVCSHQVSINAGGGSAENCWLSSTRRFNICIQRFGDSLTEFKAWLVAQYVAGTPVTFWYRLSSSTTETIPVPSGLSGTEEGYLMQSGTPSPSAPIYPTANTVNVWEHSLRKLTTATEIIAPPTTIYCDGSNITTYSIKGNTVQNGTPSPNHPLPVVGVGELETSGEHSGEYKIPISNGQGTTNIYLGNVQSTRRIEKIVYKGSSDEDWKKSSTGYNGFYITIPNHEVSTPIFCNIAQYSADGALYRTTPWYCVSDWTFGISTDSTIIGGTTVENWKAYLATLYANGTPLTMWHIRPEINTVIGIVNEPLLKISDVSDIITGSQTTISIPTTEGANSITVDTTVQPSEFTATWTGWHDASVKEWDGSDWQ